MSQKIKITLFSIIPAVVLVAILIIVKMNSNPEPLNKNEILAKKDWTQKELVYSLARNFKPQSTRRDRRQIFNHLHKQLKKYPKPVQEQIKLQAVEQAIDDSIKQYRTMKPDMRRKMVDAMKKRADKNYEAVSKMDSKQKAKMRNQVNDAASKGYTKAVDSAYQNKLTAEERRDLVPVVKKWKATMEQL